MNLAIMNGDGSTIEMDKWSIHIHIKIFLFYIFYLKESSKTILIFFFGDRGNISLEFWLTVKKQGRYRQRV